jgi:hypothetical protein
MRRWIVVAAACAAVAAASAEERWEFLLGGQLAGSEVVEESAAGFSGTGSFTFQGAKVETSYRLALDASGAPASYALALVVPGAKVAVRMLVPQALTLIAREAVRMPGTWRWTESGQSATAVQWELSSPAPLLVRAWQDLAIDRILETEIPQAKTVVRPACPDDPS